MKKALALTLALLLALPAAALSAEILADGWQDAPLEELLAAQQTIADRVSELRAADAPPAEAVTLKGTGTSIVTSVEVPVIPARVTVKGSVKVTLSGGSYDRSFNMWEESASCELLDEAGTYDVLVEGAGAWSVSIEPLKEGGTLVLSGVGPYVSDFFPLASATIVHCVMDASKSDAWSASLYLKVGHQYTNIDAWDTNNVVGDSLFSAPLKLEGDGIVKPVKNRSQYFWVVDVPVDASWSITLK